MKTMTKSAALILVVAMAGSAAIAQNRGPAPAQPPARGQNAVDQQKGPRPGGPLAHCLSILGLDEGQKTQIAAILEAARPASEAIHEQMKIDRKALKDLVGADVPDACAIGTATLKVKADRDAMKAQRQAVHASIEAVLTAEQKTKLAGCLEGAKGHRGGNGGGGQ